MMLEDFLKLYNGNAVITIEGYCNEEHYDYVALPEWVEDDKDIEEFSGNYKSSCIFNESWWKEARDREVSFFSVIGGETHKAELFISLE